MVKNSVKPKNIVAGNWKMNMDFNEGELLAAEVMRNQDFKDVEVVIAPPYIHLQRLAIMAEHYSNVFISAQNCNENQSGAYTGEISPSMLRSIGVEYVILGHSERREYFDESNELLKKKVITALKNGLKVIFCCGEPLEVRREGQHLQYVINQLSDSVFDLSKEDFGSIVIAYEPIWAIGTGETATVHQAQEMHGHIRKAIAKNYSQVFADGISILYGGSVKPDNAKELFNSPDINGGLIGGASLKSKDFLAIVGSF